MANSSQPERPFAVTLANQGGQAYEVYGDEVILDALDRRKASIIIKRSNK